MACFVKISAELAQRGIYHGNNVVILALLPGLLSRPSLPNQALKGRFPPLAVAPGFLGRFPIPTLVGAWSCFVAVAVGAALVARVTPSL